MVEKVTVIVPAFNEEQYIQNVLVPLVGWQNIDRKNRLVVVVDDGSTDKTAAIARSFGAKVIWSHASHKNKGKAQAFIAGVKEAASNGSKFLITLDADLFGLKPRQIDYMIKLLRNPKRGMIVVKAREGKVFAPLTLISGQRAFRMEFLEPIIRQNKKWLSLLKGCGLEYALNHLIPLKRKFMSKIIFSAALPFRKNGISQATDLNRANKSIDGRKELAERIRELRARGHRAKAKKALERYWARIKRQLLK